MAAAAEEGEEVTGLRALDLCAAASWAIYLEFLR